MSSILSPRQRQVLDGVCETLLPSFEVSPDPAGFYATGAHDTATATRAEQLLGALRDPLDLARLRLLLDTLENRFVNLIFTGRFVRFSQLPATERERVLQGYAHSRLALRRAGFQALKRLVHVAFYCWPVKDGPPRHPAWEHNGYPGPLPQPARQIDPLPACTVDRDLELECDVVVVGSGAGGGVVAGLLAEAGWRVVVLEKGGNPGSRDFTQVEGDMLSRYYLDGGLIMTQSGSLPILAGSCLGGGTVINYSTSFPLPPVARAEWDAISGLSLFDSARFRESLERVHTRLTVGTRWSTPALRDQLLERGCRTLGWHVEPIPRNVTDCKEGVECGYCGYGCRHGAKNSTARTYLASAARHGATLIPHCEVDRVTTDHGRANGVTGLVTGPDGRPHQIRVRARTVVAAAGSINTPALLLRSGLENPHIGRGLRLHPATAVAGVFPDRVEPWTGALQTRYSDQFADLGDGYGAKFETAPVHFALPASGFGWANARQHRDDIGRLAHLSIVGVLLRDRDPGRVVVSKAGHPRVHYELSGHDVRSVRQGLIGAAELLVAVGATELFSLHTPPVRVRPGERGWLERFTQGIDARGFTKCRMSYITFHQMASCTMAADRRRGVVSETGETFDLPGLYVADASAFVTSSGVNPMITIMAIADHVARGMLGR
ncbi:MAG TPA: GMC family oxidoreductase [Gemmatimonadales bacterium]|nr:GMC family oxidoreductase [Gemmatimonadales bacterium]